MRQLRVIEFLSLDGVMQSPGDPEEDTEGGFRHGGWQRPYFDDVLATEAAKGMAATDAYLFGRKTYEKMAAFWPTATGDGTVAPPPVRFCKRRRRRAVIGSFSTLS